MTSRWAQIAERRHDFTRFPQSEAGAGLGLLR
jgi:hypothetical protein